MIDRFLGCVIATAAVAAVVSLASVRAAGQAPRAGGDCPAEPTLFHPCALARAKAFSPPRTPDGKPDMRGFWRGQTSATENIEEHPKTEADGGGKSLVVDPPDGKIPYQPWAAAQRKENREKYIDPNMPCFLSGVPRTLYIPTQIQILQSPGYFVILIERAHGYRIIPTGGGSPVGEGIHLWQGNSRGRWEGNTLVVDVTNQNAKPWFDQSGNFFSDAVRMVERFTLIDADTVHYENTVEDPNVYTRPWKMAFRITRLKEEGFELLEESCHEGERNTEGLIGLGYKIYPGMPAKKER